MDTIEKQAQQTAHNFTIKGVEGLIRNAKLQLTGIDEMDRQYGDVGGEARAHGRTIWQERLAVAERALAIHQDS